MTPIARATEGNRSWTVIVDTRGTCQHVIPALTNLAGEMLQAAGKDAVRTAVAPMRFMNGDGTVLREQATGFELPPGYEQPTVAAVVTKVVKGAAASVAAVLAAGVFRR
jgi:hypothetical protein